MSARRGFLKAFLAVPVAAAGVKLAAPGKLTSGAAVQFDSQITNLISYRDKVYISEGKNLWCWDGERLGLVRFE